MFHRLVTLLTVAAATAIVGAQEPPIPRLRPFENLNVFPTTTRPIAGLDFLDPDAIMLVKVKSYTRNVGLTRGFDPGSVATDSSAVATVLDHAFRKELVGKDIFLSDIDFKGYTKVPLQPGKNYLVYASRSLQGSLTRIKRALPYDPRYDPSGPLEQIFTARANERFLSMAVATKAKKLPSTMSSDTAFRWALIDAFSTATGREALVISSIMYCPTNPQEGIGAMPLAELPEPYRKVAEIGELTKDPYQRLAAKVILTRWGVAGAPGELMNALAKVAEVAPKDMEARDLALFAKGGFFHEPTFYYKDKVRGPEGLKYDTARFVKAAIRCKNPAIQENMLGDLKPGDLDKKQAAALVRRFDDPKPANYSSRWWSAHLESIAYALETNTNVAPKDFKHQGIWDEATQRLDMSSAIQYWKTTYHVN